MLLHRDVDVQNTISVFLVSGTLTSNQKGVRPTLEKAWTTKDIENNGRLKIEIAITSERNKHFT